MDHQEPQDEMDQKDPSDLLDHKEPEDHWDHVVVLVPQDQMDQMV